jgi:hypothetical protein
LDPLMTAEGTVGAPTCFILNFIQDKSLSPQECGTKK